MMMMMMIQFLSYGFTFIHKTSDNDIFTCFSIQRN